MADCKDTLLAKLLLNCVFALLFLCLAMLIALMASAQTTGTETAGTETREETSERSRAIDARLQRLYRQVRCPVCAGQPISESDAPLSRILREKLAKKIEAGESDEEALAWLVARYGEGILLRPRFSSAALLWLAPLVFAFASLLLFRARTRG